MSEEFAFESDEVSIAFGTLAGLGDAVIARKVFDALIELVPNCRIDFYCLTAPHKTFAAAFFGDSKNLNRLLSKEEHNANMKKYDVSLYVGGCHAIFFDYVNINRLNEIAPNLLQCLIKIENYNRVNIYQLGEWRLTAALRNMTAAQILGKNWHHFLAYEGALPIRDDKINIPLKPEFQPEFDALNLGRYITIYTDIDESEKNRPKVKTWPLHCHVEFVARMKKRRPDIKIVQVGGHGDLKVENADRHVLGCDLELTKHILANSLLNVGCEGGLTHLATALGTKCIVLFGSNSVEYFGYPRNINLVSEVCRPCMYIVPDFQVCMLGAKVPPCMLSLTPRTVCDVACEYLKNNA